MCVWMEKYFASAGFGLILTVMKALAPLVWLASLPMCMPGQLLAADSSVLERPSVPASPQPVTDEPLFASPTRLDRIGRIVAPVMINGQGPFRLVVDTGASHTTLSPELAGRLALVPAADAALMLNGVTGAEEVPAVLIDRLQAGDLLVERSLAPIVRSTIMAGADGILGVAGLTKERISVDFRKDRIAISRSRASDDHADMLRIPAIRVTGGLLMVIARVGGVRVQAIIDTGAERTLGNTSLLNALRIRKRLTESSRVTQVFGTTTEPAVGELQLVPPIVLGTASVSQVHVVFGDFHIFKLWDLENRPTILIGMDVLGTVQQLIIDYRRREVYVRS
jgi:predicted aspartyl protease